jgi:polysaccharide biosynthesis transport protein
LEEEIDLRPYVEAVVKRWPWVLGTAIALALVAFVVSSLLPPTYETIALVAITEPNQLVRFETGFQAVDDVVSRPLRAYPELAVSDELLQAVLTEVQASVPEEITLSQLQELTHAESGADPSLIRLAVRYHNPEVAALIANRWATLFVARANNVYGSAGGSQLTTFDTQLAQLTEELETVEQKLVEFQSRNRLGILDSELLALQDNRTDLVNDQLAAMALKRDVEALRALMVAQSANSIGLADQLTALLLQIATFYSNETGETPIILQLDGNTATLTTDNRREQIATLDNLLTVIEAQLTNINGEVMALEPQILAVQEEREMFSVEYSQLTRTRDTVQEAFLALSRRVEEERIAAQGTGEGVRLASEAAVPMEPVAPRRLINTAMAGGLGLLVSFSFVLALVWWQSRAIKPAID